MLIEQMQFRLYGYALDAPFPTTTSAPRPGVHPACRSLMDRADREGLTVWGVRRPGAKSRSHGTYMGTRRGGLVDHMRHWQEKQRMQQVRYHADVKTR